MGCMGGGLGVRVCLSASVCRFPAWWWRCAAGPVAEASSSMFLYKFAQIATSRSQMGMQSNCGSNCFSVFVSWMTLADLMSTPSCFRASMGLHKGGLPLSFGILCFGRWSMPSEA